MPVLASPSATSADPSPSSKPNAVPPASSFALVLLMRTLLVLSGKPGKRSFDLSGQILQEARGRSTIDDTVIEGQAQRHHLARGDLAGFLINHYRARLDAPDTQNRALGQVNDRREGVDPERP